MSRTRTGSFPIGFRRGGGPWQKDLDAVIAWAKANEFECLDVAGAEAVERTAAAGLAVGSADLPDPRAMISPDKAQRDAAVEAVGAYVRRCCGQARSFFCVMLPQKPELPRKENFGYMVDSYGRLMPVLAECGARLVVEGWPGPGALCCTPETYRAFFREMDSPAAGVNYDPSHLIRMGIDPLRFLREFADRVGHVHGKDTELLDERLYELGHEQPATFAPGIAFGGTSWRYTIPGHGVARWGEILRILEAAGYQGRVSVELEDAHFNGTEDGEKLGLLLARRFLEGC